MAPDGGFEPAGVVKRLLREAQSGALATRMADTGDPYCSLVNVASAADGTPLLLLSGLAVHTRNLRADPRAALLLAEAENGDPLDGARVTVSGTVLASDAAADRRRYLARHPQAAHYADFGDFGFYRLAIARAHLVAGFGRIVDLAPAAILTALRGAEALLAVEDEVTAHMNDDHAATCRLYATRLLRAEDGPWRCVGCDPDGLDLQCGRTVRRLAFPERVTSPALLRAMLQRLAALARSS